MKRVTWATTLMLWGVSSSAVCVQGTPADSLRTIQLNDVEVVATRATRKMPIAFTNVDKGEIARQNKGRDLPFLLLMSPSVVATSDAGTGIGYTSIRVRGTDASRINITANGIPVNDAESHQVFWVNMPDFASSVKDLQIQRGAGTSTNGAAAFGASIAMQTADLSTQPYTRFDASFGSFGTHKETFSVGTGLLKDHWTFDLRLSNVGSDGYVDRASVKLHSYYLQAGYIADKTSIKFISFAGKERTYHAWNGVSPLQEQLLGRTFNSSGFMYVVDRQGTRHDLSPDYDTEKISQIVADGGKIRYYDGQTDNYIQKNYQLLLHHHFSPRTILHVGAHYTKGDGYYQEYKQNRKLIEYGLTPFTLNGQTIKKTQLIRRKNLDNHFGGAVFSLRHKTDRLDATVGGAINRYYGKHFGEVLWVENYIGHLDPDQHYYDSYGSKNDYNIYAKATYEVAHGLNIYGDVQFRHIHYKIGGQNDEWDDIAGTMQQLNVNEHFNFFNPKVGLFYDVNSHHKVYASFSVAHREPTRNNYTDASFRKNPVAERMFDYEAGYQYATPAFQAGVNLYYMNYRDQLILTGAKNEIGEAISENIPRSYRMGVELMAKVELPCGFHWNANATVSRNRIKDFTEILTYWEGADANPIYNERGTTPIAYSPSFTAGNYVGYAKRGFEVGLQSNYVGKQHTSNANREDQMMKAYFVSNLQLGYTFSLPFLKSATVGCTVYNLFNAKYANNGFSGSGYNDQRERYVWNTYSVQAGTHFLGHLSLTF